MCQDRNAGKQAAPGAIHLRWQHDRREMRKDGPYGRHNERNNQPEREVYLERYRLSHCQVRASRRICTQHATYRHCQCRQCPEGEEEEVRCILWERQHNNQRIRCCQEQQVQNAAPA